LDAFNGRVGSKVDSYANLTSRCGIKQPKNGAVVCRRGGVRSSFDQLQDFPESRVIGVLQQLEQHHLRADRDCSRLLQASKGCFPVPLRSGGDAVRDDMNEVALFEQLQGCLADTDVGFDARDNRLGALEPIQLFSEGLAAEAAEARFYDTRNGTLTEQLPMLLPITVTRSAPQICFWGAAERQS